MAARAGEYELQYEFQRFWLSRSYSRSTVCRLLIDRAEYGGWELDRLRLLPDGRRRVTMRRQIIRAVRTL
ncbi:MAG: hypothetical protein H0U77_07495 [Nocardioidaceae bacterium]|nr:hypothetical protein [Nocardioidaceae bacterium]